MWRVTIPAHEVHRWWVPECVAVVPGVSGEAACATVARWAHCDAGVPPLRSLTAITLVCSRAERLGVVV